MSWFLHIEQSWCSVCDRSVDVRIYTYCEEFTDSLYVDHHCVGCGWSEKVGYQHRTIDVSDCNLVVLFEREYENQKSILS